MELSASRSWLRVAGMVNSMDDWAVILARSLVKQNLLDQSNLPLLV
jgi:hypothetical protein